MLQICHWSLVKAENVIPLKSFEIQTLVFMYFAFNLLTAMHVALLFVTMEYKTFLTYFIKLKPQYTFW